MLSSFSIEMKYPGKANLLNPQYLCGNEFLTKWRKKDAEAPEHRDVGREEKGRKKNSELSSSPVLPHASSLMLMGITVRADVCSF